MPEITIPAAVRIANLQWTSPPTYQVNRSDLTGKTRVVQLGPAERWFATGDLVPVRRADAAAVRGFLGMMKRPENVVHLTIPQAVQTAPGNVTTALVNGGGQLGLSLNIKGLTPSVINLRAGDLIMIAYASDDSQAIVLGADLVANGSGNAAATLTTPLRRSPLNDTPVVLNLPWARMRMRNPLQWSVVPGPIYSSPCEFEEAF